MVGFDILEFVMAPVSGDVVDDEFYQEIVGAEKGLERLIMIAPLFWD